MTEIVENVRKTSKPILIEMQTYRFRGHSVSDPGNYRTKEEVEKERQKDPLALLKSILLEKKLAAESDFEKWEEEVSTQVEEAVQFAEDSPEPELSALYEDVLL